MLLCVSLTLYSVCLTSCSVCHSYPNDFNRCSNVVFCSNACIAFGVAFQPLFNVSKACLMFINVLLCLSICVMDFPNVFLCLSQLV